LLLVPALLVACTNNGPATTEPDTYRLALVALAEDAETRAAFEDGLAAKLGASDYDAVASRGIVPELPDLSQADLVPRLSQAGIQGIVMMRPAAIGPGSSLESVKDEVSAEEYNDMRAFARQVSPTHSDELVAVVHTAFYMIRGNNAELLSSGAVWLDEPVASREEGIDKLQNLIVVNMNRARPTVREYLGLPPLQQ
jgi:hypothetical protein